MRLLPLDPVRRAAVLLAFLAVAGVYFVQTYALSPGADELKELEARLVELKDQTRHGEVVTGDRMDLEHRLGVYTDLVERLEPLIPTGEQVPALLAAIATEERRAGVEVTMLRPDPPEPSEYYERRSYQLAVRGGYHAIGSFLTAIGSLDHIVATDDMVVAAEAVAPGYHGAEPVTAVASFRVDLWVAPVPKADRQNANERM